MTVAQRSPETLRRDALANRERILAAARECFASEGVDAPVEEIARRAGVGMGTLYRRFPTKADLIDAVLEDDLERFVAIAERRLLDDDPWNGFAGFLVEALELHAENLALREALATESHGGARLEAVRARLRPVVARLVARAQASGQLRGDFSARDLPLVFLTAGRVIQATSPVAPDLWRRYLGLLLDGLRADGATPLPHRPLTRAQLDRLHARKAG